MHSHAQKLQEDLVQVCRPLCLPKKAKPLKTTMSEDSWELVCQKRDSRNALAAHNRSHRLTVLTAWFACWKHAVCDLEFEALAAAFDRLLRQQDILIAVEYQHFRILGRQVVKALRKDDITFYDNLLHDGAAFLGPKQVKGLWNVVRRSLPKFQQRKMSTPPFQMEGFEDQWTTHFCQLEAGCPTTLQELHRTCFLRQLHSLFDAPRDLLVTQLPSLFSLEDAFRQTQADKATGDDPLPSALFHQAARPLAGLYHDLLIKEYIWQAEPLQYKGGPVAIIPKCLVPKTTAQFRGILLLGNMAKRTHSVIRKQLMSHLERVRAPGQLGGFPGQQVMFGSQALRLFCSMADTKGVSCAVLFLDLSNAFHHLVRELVTGIAHSSSLEVVLETLTTTQHPTERIRAACSLPGLLEKLGAPDCLVRLLRDIHAETWCSLPDQSVLHTHRGTRPGSPLADIIFHVLMKAVAEDIDEWVGSHDVHSAVLDVSETHFPCIVWADDVAVPVATTDATQLVPLLSDLLQAIHGFLHVRGFTLNFALGKTNAVVTFRGPCAGELRKQYQLVPRPGVQCQLTPDFSTWLHFVPAYKHLGTVFTSNHGLDIELATRIGMANSAFTHLARPLLTNRHLPVELRLRLFHALVSSKLFFGLGAWHTLSPKQAQKLTGFYVRVLKRVLRLPKAFRQYTNAQIFAHAKVLDVRARLAVDRLLYANRVFTTGPPFLQHVIQMEETVVENSWFKGLKADLHWLHEVMPMALPSNWAQDMTSLFDLWQSPTCHWKAVVKAAARKHRLQEQLMSEVVSLHHDIFAVLRTGGVRFVADPFLGQAHGGDHECFCGAGFSTYRGLLAHQRRKHEIFSLERQFLQGATCLHCGRYCWTTQRLQQHLAYIPKTLGYNPCFQALSAQGRQVPYEAVLVPKAVLGLSRRECLPTYGPQVEQVTALSKQRLRWQEQLDECQHQLEITHMPDSPLEVGAQIGDALSEVTQAWFEKYYPQGPSNLERQELIDTWIQVLCVDFGDNNPDWDNWLAFVFLAWGNHWLPDLVATFVDGEAEYAVDELFAEFATELPRYQILAQISHLESCLRNCVETVPVPHRQPRPVDLVSHPKKNSKISHKVPRAYGEQHLWHERLRQSELLEAPELHSCPRYKVVSDLPTFLVAHLFSGRRREGDFHFELSKLAADRNWRVIVLSLDTAVSGEFGNLMRHTVSWNTLAEIYRSGRIAATLCGPPCETFSEARFTEKPEEDSGTGAGPRIWPRPLRSSERLFGLEGLNLKELRQCSVGSAFFLQCIWALCIHITTGGVFIAEHPAPPKDVSRPSIWTSAVIQLLLGLPDLTLHCVAQYRWGADAVKPTGLLVWDLPFFRQDMYRFALSDVAKPQTAAIGVDSAGQFRTARHKEYPGLFCQALAFSVAQQFDRFVRSGRIRAGPIADTVLDEWIWNAAQISSEIHTGAQWLPDFQNL